MRYLRLALLPPVFVACTEVGTQLTDPRDAPLFEKQGGSQSTESYDVGFTSFVIHDGTRGDRPIPVYVWYPADPAGIDETTPEAVYPLDPFFGELPDATSGNFEQYGLDRAYQEPAPVSDGVFPLVMFSPGWGAAAPDHIYIGTRLARHGAIVAIVTHYGDWTTPSEPWDHLTVASYNRPRDVSAALDAVLGMSLLGGLIDESMIVASGWSLGGYAAMVLAGGDDSVCDLTDVFPQWPMPDGYCVPSFPDPRINMIIPLDGSNQVLHFAELARVTLPALSMGQEWTTVDDWQARQHAAFSGHPSYRVDVNQANHLSFSNLCESAQVWGDLGIITPGDVAGLLASWCGPEIIDPLEAHRLVTQYMIAFLHRQQRYLTPGYALTSEPDIEFFVTEKRDPHSIDDEWPDYFIYFMHQPGSATARAAKDPEESLGVHFVGRWR